MYTCVRAYLYNNMYVCVIKDMKDTEKSTYLVRTDTRGDRRDLTTFVYDIMSSELLFLKRFQTTQKRILRRHGFQSTIMNGRLSW